MAAIGNTLGRFIKVDDQALSAPQRRMGKILVEVDIHTGLLESLEIHWRGHTISQKTGLLGITFSCTLCRRTDHLRNDCQGFSEEEESEDSLLRKVTRFDSPSVDSYEQDAATAGLRSLFV
jgi:hypothetical protein